MKETHQLPSVERLDRVLAYAFRGIHHAGKIKKHSDDYWETNIFGGISTFDFDHLTRLVLAAHKWAVRVEITSSGPRMVKLHLSARTREGSVYSRHPDIDSVVSEFKQLVDV